MQSFLVTANDTDSGKTFVTGALAKVFAHAGKTVQIVKAVECGRSGDAEFARRFAGHKRITAHTLIDLPAPLAPLAEANRVGQTLTLTALLNAFEDLPAADVRLIEGAGGVAVPIDPSGLDWRSFAEAYPLSGVIAVVENRLGAINQSRLVCDYLKDLPHALFLNEARPTDESVKASNALALRDLGLKLLGMLDHNGEDAVIFDPEWLERETAPAPAKSLKADLQERRRAHTLRSLTARAADEPYLNLADNDYLRLSQNQAVKAAAIEATARWGSSASASPLISGYTEAHAALEADLSAWYRDRPALVWNSGYAANQAVLKLLIQRGDLVLADRLIHNSLIAGVLATGARLVRFAHNDLDQLEALLKLHAGGRNVHVVCESVYSMDGDYPDLKRLAGLKSSYGFNWFLDEAHAVGWYGQTGAGLAEACDCLGAVDVLTGTLGKALGSMGAYTLFAEDWQRDACINFAGELIYSTYLPPASAAAAQEAIRLTRAMAYQRTQLRDGARQFRSRLRAAGFTVIGDDSPIVPLVLGDSGRALAAAEALLARGIRVAAIRPPTVPKDAARLRISLNAALSAADYDRLVDAMTEVL